MHFETFFEISMHAILDLFMIVKSQAVWLNFSMKCMKDAKSLVSFILTQFSQIASHKSIN